jgi:hypothetical protein
LHLLGRLDPELVPEEITEEPILPHRFAYVPFLQVHANDGPVCTFAERIGGDGGESQLKRLLEPTGVEQALAELLERVEAQLPMRFALDEDPVLVPVRQQVAGQGGRIDVEPVRARLIEYASCDGVGSMEVDVNLGAEGELMPGHLNDARDTPG